MTDTATADTTATPATTTLGSPASARWDAAWLAEVDAAETRLNRRICGAHAPDGTPCELDPAHENGRCPYHGGAPNIGAQPGNKNAQTHGLYSRQLRQCDNSCPLWNHCPYAREQVMQLRPKARPICAYEDHEYHSLLETLQGYEHADDPWTNGQHHTLALLQTLANRAARALSVHHLTETTKTQSETYTFATEKVSAIATAFFRLLREFRSHLRTYCDTLGKLGRHRTRKEMEEAKEAMKHYKARSSRIYVDVTDWSDEQLEAAEQAKFERALKQWKGVHPRLEVNSEEALRFGQPERHDFHNSVGRKRKRPNPPHPAAAPKDYPWP